MISRTSCAHRQPLAMRAAHANASSRVGTSIIEKPPTTAFVSGTGPSEAVPSGATIVACWRRTPPPKIQTPAALASRTTACEASPTSGQSPSGMWFIEPSSNEIRYRGISVPPILGSVRNSVGAVSNARTDHPSLSGMNLDRFSSWAGRAQHLHTPRSISSSSSRLKILASFGSSSWTTLDIMRRLRSMMAEIFSSNVPSVTSLKTCTARFWPRR